MQRQVGVASLIMKSGLRILGIFLATGTLLAAGVGFWYYLPYQQEKILEQRVAEITKQISPTLDELIVLDQRWLQSTNRDNWAAQTAWQIDHQLKEAPILGMENQQQEYLQVLNFIRQARRERYLHCFQATGVLAIFTLLAFFLSWTTRLTGVSQSIPATDARRSVLLPPN